MQYLIFILLVVVLFRSPKALLMLCFVHWLYCQITSQQTIWTKISKHFTKAPNNP